MRANLFSTFTTALVTIAILALTSSGCGSSYEETISGVKVPVPNGMAKNSEKPAEMSFLGFGAGQASFHGKMETDKVVEFYKKELAARGWEPNMNLQSGGAMLPYAKEGKTLLIAVDKANDDTTLTLTLGGMGK
jgi:hypothetical protein